MSASVKYESEVFKKNLREKMAAALFGQGHHWSLEAGLDGLRPNATPRPNKAELGMGGGCTYLETERTVRP